MSARMRRLRDIIGIASHGVPLSRHVRVDIMVYPRNSQFQNSKQVSKSQC
jgi:hypothetical protein